MPLYDKGDVRIYYEEVGSGFPLMVIPGGGLNSTVAGLATQARAEETWMTSYADALKTAAKEKKVVLMDFTGSDWCGWCHKMDSSMSDPKCSKFFRDNYVTVHLVVDETKGKKNLENPGAAEMKVKYHGDGQGIPFWLVFDKEGKLLASGDCDGFMHGCLGTMAAVRHLRNLPVPKELIFSLMVIDQTNYAGMDVPYEQRICPSWESVVKSN